MTNYGILWKLFAGSALVLIGAATSMARDLHGSVNLLPLGDSITAQGYYIAPLQAMLGDRGCNATQIANEGHSGYKIIDLDACIATSLDYPQINVPNTYILLMAGINDLTDPSVTVDVAASRMEILVADITEIAPLAHLIVARLTPANGFASASLPAPMVDARVMAFNETIAPIVGGFGPNVSMVDMHAPFQPDIYSPYTSVDSPYYQSPGTGNVHPNSLGGQLMAAVWCEGISITMAPEPGSAVLMLTGLVSFAWCAWRKQRVKKLN